MFGQIGRLINRIALSDRNYRFLFEAEPGNEAVSLDCETTGFDHWVDEIVSVAAIRIVGRRIEASTVFRALVKPDSAIRPASIKVHQLREIDVAGSRPMAEVLPDLLHFIGSRPLVGYWIDFDVRMLDKYLLAMINTRLPNRRIDVSKLYYDRKFGSAPRKATSCSRTCASVAYGCRATRRSHTAAFRWPDHAGDRRGCRMSRGHSRL